MNIERAVHVLDQVAIGMQRPQKEITKAIITVLDVVKKAQWIPISERLPDTYTAVLVSDGKYVWIDSLEDDFDSGGNYVVWWDSSNYVDFDKTAWMPIPEPWKGEENDK